MGFLLAIEGADGAGKGTATAAVVEALRARGTTATSMSFPRYTDTSAGWVLGEYLGDRLPRIMTPQAAAAFYALDRFESRDALTDAVERNEVVVLDRYIASNIVYQAARVPAGGASALMAWIVALEIGQFALPRPDLSIYLDTPPAAARAHVLLKHRRSYTDQALDTYEMDDALQARVRSLYDELTRTDLIGEWTRVETVDDDRIRTPAAIADEIVGIVVQRMEPVA